MFEHAEPRGFEVPAPDPAFGGEVRGQLVDESLAGPDRIG
jgi:hypothetical protein